MKDYIKKEIAFERIVFFSDAVVAIAITLLALEIKIEVPTGSQLSYKNLLEPYPIYLGFLLSFIIIASYWKTHHDLFALIHKIDERVLSINSGWLFFIILIPFTTSVLSTHFGQSPSVFLYSANIFMLSIFQKWLWHNCKPYIDVKTTEKDHLNNYNFMLIADILNAGIGVALSFFYPKFAFIIMFFKLPILIIGIFFIGRKRAIEIKRRSK